ncbi:LytTR family DNA-binding domain-containing protein [Mycoplasmatota bacterium WC44]
MQKDGSVIRNLLNNYSNNNNISFNISEFSSSEELLKGNWITSDIIFLDIMMDSLDGVEAAKLIRKSHSRDQIKIIFTTSLSNRWNEGFDVDADDYLIKPLKNRIRFIRNMDKIYSNFKMKNKNIEVFGVRGSKFIPVDKILYLEKRGKSIKLVCNNSSEKLFKHTITALEEELIPLDFIGIHRSILVNLKHVDYIEDGDIVMINGMKMLISKYRFDFVLEEFRKYMEGN